MNIAKFQATLRSRGMRLSDDDPIFMLLSANEKMLKEILDEFLKNHALKVDTAHATDEFVRHNLAVLTAGAVIIILLLSVGAFWLGRVWEFVSSQLALGFGFGLVAGFAITIIVINVSSEPQ